MTEHHSESRETILPKEPIDRVLEPVVRFLHVESAGGIVLLLATAVAIIWANSPFSESYFALWKTKVGLSIGSFQFVHSLKHWVSDGLMVIFFFVVGLEVKRELVIGELREFKRALLPVAAALGGMVVPAGIYLILQKGQPGEHGWGIPMATDIAFVVGVLAVLGSRVPHILRVLLLSLAIVDDIGAILVIAIGYTTDINLTALGLAFLGLAVVFLFGRLGIRSFAVYTVLGVLVWLGFHESGVHATIAGVLLGLLTPVKPRISTGAFSRLLERANQVLHGGEWENAHHRGSQVRAFQRASREVISPLEYLEDRLHPWSSFFIMPVFALANAGVAIHFSDFLNSVSLSVTAGLVIGKVLGITLFSWLAVRFITKTLPEGLNWRIIIGGGFLGGIGFTMALFIAGLALEGTLLDAAKIGIIGGSFLAAVFGVTILLLVLPAANKTSS